MSTEAIGKALQNHFDKLGLTQVAIAERLGVSKAYVNSLFTGKRPFGKKQAEIWETEFGISRAFLLSGEGNVLKDKSESIDDIIAPTSSEDSNVMIPLVHIDSVGGVHSPNALVSSEQYIERLVPFPDARPGDVAILQSGNSMAPTIPAGAILQIRRVEGWREYFGYGSDFVLWLTDDRRITKQILKYEPDPANYVTCHSYNPEAADEELPKKMIQEVWKVVNVLINKGW